MTKGYRYFLWTLIGVSLFFTILSGYQVTLGNQMKLDPSFWRFGYLYGAYAWIDLLVFPLLWVILGVILLRLKRPIYFLLAFSCFWFIRSLGETFYWFLQQFHPETIPWEQYFLSFWFLNGLSDKEYWVFNQIVNQSISVLSLFGIFYSLTKITKDGKN